MILLKKEELRLEKKYLDKMITAFEFLNVADYMKKKSVKTNANRLYFALETGCIAYLLFLGEKVPKNHSTIFKMIEKRDKNLKYNLEKLYDLRMQADYGNSSKFVELNEDVVVV